MVEHVDILDAVERANYLADSKKFRLSANDKSRAVQSISVGGIRGQSTEIATKTDYSANGKKSFIQPSGRKSEAIPELVDEEMSMELRQISDTSHLAASQHPEKSHKTYAKQVNFIYSVAVVGDSKPDRDLLI